MVINGILGGETDSVLVELVFGDEESLFNRIQIPAFQQPIKRILGITFSEICFQQFSVPHKGCKLSGLLAEV